MKQEKKIERKIENKQGLYKMFSIKRIFIILLVTLSTPALFTNCGGSPYSESDANSSSDASSSDSSDDSDSSSDGDSDSSSEEEEDFSGALSYEFSLTGYDDTETYEVQTDSILKVKALPGNGILTVEGYGYNFYYSCTKYTIEINGYEIQTNYLAVEGATRYSGDMWLALSSDPCETAESEQIIDLSGYIGTGDEDITVSSVQTDYRCVNYWTYGLSYCGTMQSTYSTHIVTGQILVLTNGS